MPSASSRAPPRRSAGKSPSHAFPDESADSMSPQHFRNGSGRVDTFIAVLVHGGGGDVQGGWCAPSALGPRSPMWSADLLAGPQFASSRPRLCNPRCTRWTRPKRWTRRSSRDCLTRACVGGSHDELEEPEADVGFVMQLMAIETEEHWGGSGASFMSAILAIEGAFSLSNARARWESQGADSLLFRIGKG